METDQKDIPDAHCCTFRIDIPEDIERDMERDLSMQEEKDVDEISPWELWRRQGGRRKEIKSNYF